MDIRNILIPTDFSDCADHALTQAVDLADRFGATLHLLHVVDELDADWYGVPDAKNRATALREVIRDAAQARLHEIAPSDEHEDFQTTVSLQLSFDVAATIHEYVNERDIDLVVMGTHGRRGLERMMLGNVADKLIRHSPCPVLTVSERVPWETTAEGLQVTDILAPIDFSEHSKQALRSAKTFAHRYDARLHLQFIAEQRTVPTFSDLGVPGLSVIEMDPEIVENAEKALAQLNDSVGGPEVEVVYKVTKGNVEGDIIDYAETNGVNLIVMATRGLTGIDRFLIGSTTERIVRVAPCPVLTIQTDVDTEA